jgi:hypothetical protein
MRKLLAKDIGPFTKVLVKMELKESLKEFFRDKTKDKKAKEPGEVATDLVWLILENYPKAENDFFAFLAGLEGKTAEEIAELPAADFINLMTELFSGENFPFFKSAVQ